MGLKFVIYYKKISTYSGKCHKHLKAVGYGSCQGKAAQIAAGYAATPLWADPRRGLQQRQGHLLMPSLEPKKLVCYDVVFEGALLGLVKHLLDWSKTATRLS